MYQDDFLLRMIRQAAQALAAALSGRRERDDAEAAVERHAGLSLDVAGRLPAATLLGLLTTADGLAADRALVLALGLAARAKADPDGPDAARLRAQADALASAALQVRPELATDEVVALLTD